MAKIPKDANEGTPPEGAPCDFNFFGNVNSRLNIPGLNVGLPIWLWSTMNIMNSLEASQIRILFQGNYMYFNHSYSFLRKFRLHLSTSCSEILATSNKRYQWSIMRRNKKNKNKVFFETSPTSTSHVGGMSPLTTNHTSKETITSACHVHNESPKSASHVHDKLPTTMSHVGFLKPSTTSQ